MSGSNLFSRRRNEQLRIPVQEYLQRIQISLNVDKNGICEVSDLSIWSVTYPMNSGKIQNNDRNIPGLRYFRSPDRPYETGDV